MDTKEFIDRHGIHPLNLLRFSAKEHQELWDSLPAENRIEFSAAAITATLGQISTPDGYTCFSLGDRLHVMRAIDKLIDAKIEKALSR